MCKICSKLLKKTPKRSSWRCAAVFIANFDQNLHIVLVYQLLTLSKWTRARVALDQEERSMDEKLSPYLCAAEKGIYPFGAWCPLKGHTYCMNFYLSMYELLVDRKY